MIADNLSSGSAPPQGQADVLPRCSVCRQVPQAGIRGGFKLRSGFFCQECESIIMETQVGSSDYRRIMAGLRSIY